MFASDYENPYGRTGQGLPPAPPLPQKPKKNKLLRSPLVAIKNALLKSTKPLRRQISLSEADEPKKLKSILKRQNSMMEPRMMRQRERQRDVYGYAQQQPLPPLPHHAQHGAQQPIYMQTYAQYPLPPPPPQSRHEPYHPSSYQNLDQSDYGYGYYEQENLYANRARIDLERRAMMAPHQVQMHGAVGGVGAYETGTGSRLMRRHSLRDRGGGGSGGRGTYTPTSETGAYPKSRGYIEEPIYQSKRGSYLLHETRESARRFEESPYQHRRELHRNHLYQSKEEMQERIYQSRREFEKLSPEGGSPVTTPSSDEASEMRRREMKERGVRSKIQLREQIYQSRREAMETMAEPIYVSKREIKREETIYEKKEEQEEPPYKFPPLPAPPKSPPPPPPDSSNDSTLKSSDATVISTKTDNNKKEAPLASIDSEEDEDAAQIKANESDLEKAAAAAEKIKVSTPLLRRQAPPSHISNIIKRTAAPQGTQIYASRTSMDTNYQSQIGSQMSLPTGPPNAQSTPYTSDLSLTKHVKVPASPLFLPTVPREPITSRGVFDANGGTLEDKLWNVSLVIPPGAIADGVKQEVYFTVTDPRMAQLPAVGGPPLDMENGA